MQWLRLGFWWHYLIRGTDYKGRAHWVQNVSHLVCRLRGHPCGVVWYTMSQMEPDMTCNGCGDDLA